MEFFMAMIPPATTHQEKKIRVVHGKPSYYEPVELKAARQKLTAHLARHAPAEKMVGSIRLKTIWCFPRGKHRDGAYRTSRPDTDNLQKLLKDVMTTVGFWQDDAQVAVEQIEKYWAELPGIYIEVEEIEK